VDGRATDHLAAFLRRARGNPRAAPVVHKFMHMHAEVAPSSDCPKTNGRTVFDLRSEERCCSFMPNAFSDQEFIPVRFSQSSKLPRQPDEVPSTWPELRSEDANTRPTPDLVDGVEDIHDVEAQGQRLGIGESELV